MHSMIFFWTEKDANSRRGVRKDPEKITVPEVSHR
jgi:hypothetical protein